MLYIKLPNYKNLLNSLFDFNLIRFLKVLHMSQDSAITAIFAFIIGYGLNIFFNLKYDEETYVVITKIFLHLIFLTIVIYYSRKLTKFIPFLLRFTKSYKPFHRSRDGESLIGSAIALSLMIMITQRNLKDRLKIVINKINKFLNVEHVYHKDLLNDLNDDLDGDFF